MNRIHILSLLLASPYALADDIAWFENHWISDVEATVQANPTVDAWEKPAQQDFRKLFGKMRWTVSDGVLSSEQPGYPIQSAAYSIRGIGDNTFEVSLYSDSDPETVMVIHKTASGFCTSWGTGWEVANNPIEQQSIVECFMRNDV